ncbi:hypothetical protein COCC4DRAFT_31426 [Bipolaris maydis ATCC 48331]|uniref:Uncharacterized protein n=2 Tax=Cochliobolus heterostrophus TaxID=5016 RepID=M2U0J6_COCH5|nr:uncharacterized protein COCC4DRAFT_31426 [Bipolaris maydis ATCC 48331]EMD87591.1 hypothetical protein COCHEDRAFT_1023621 [Bipolaris maydis C5]ENI06790.1 hypothetical protein COCC4DRAFT_31426 [Bipolaris maydis ATCC 48331]
MHANEKNKQNAKARDAPKKRCPPTIPAQCFPLPDATNENAMQSCKSRDDVGEK